MLPSSTSGSPMTDDLARKKQDRPSRPPPRIYSVPADQPFLRVLARALLTGDLPASGGIVPGALDLAGITLYLPTRRATRALEEAFLSAGHGKAMLLPRIFPIAESDEDLTLLTEISTPHADANSASDAGPTGSAITELHRRLALTQLVMRWSEAMRAAAPGGMDGMEPFAATGSSRPAQAVMLASELTRLMDMVETEGASLEGISGLVPETYSEHWQHTLRFLEIVTAHWPDYLSAQGLLSPAARRNAIILAEARRLERAPPAGPVIVAGVTGSVPATIALMRAVCALPNGAIVLPALDTTLDEASWQTIVPDHPEHPQYGLAKLLNGLSLSRDDVKLLSATAGGHTADQSRRSARMQLISETMRPQRTTDRWQSYIGVMRDSGQMDEALHGLSLVETPTAQDEAEVIALIMREAAETPERTAALVSPDRLLARRVAIRLESWGIRVDDSAGRPFAKTVPGAFLDLVISALETGFAPAETMALLKHPLTRLGLDPFTIRRSARTLEIAAFRAAYLGYGLDGIEAAIEAAAHGIASGERRHRAVRRIRADDWNSARDLVAALKRAYAPLLELQANQNNHSLAGIAAAHVQVAEALACLPVRDQDNGDAEPASALWQREAGESAQRFFGELLDPSLPGIDIPVSDYADIYRSLVSSLNVRPRIPVHPRLSIWGPFEARLQQTDLVILGSLNEGTWPQAADPGPWLNRPMRASLNLPSPEEKIGHAAHDFACLLGAREVVMTRAQKMDGVPTVPSRWLLRLQALLSGAAAPEKLTAPQPWLAWALERTAPRPGDHRERIAQPEPRPPVAMRPRRLSVSRVEAFITNPYAIFARDILGLEPLDPLGQNPGPALRGSIIHEALSRFSREHAEELPPGIEEALNAVAHRLLADYRTHPRIAAFWVPRFERFAKWFAETEAERRDGVTRILAETDGQIVIEAPGGPFTLTARADRIDVRADGLVITDYKTGSAPKASDVKDGVKPQLPLEAAIAIEGGFTGLPAQPVTGLRYILASGGLPPGADHTIRDQPGDLAANSLAALKSLIARFDDPATPYRPVRRQRFKYDYDAFTHLARVAEWSGEEASENDGDGA